MPGDQAAAPRGASTRDGRSAPIRVKAGTNAINYLPQAVAITNGYFREHDVDVELEVVGPGPAAARAVLQGDADLALGGLWRPGMYRGIGIRLDAIANILQKCPSFLLGRSGATGRSWRALEGSTVLVCADVPSPVIVLDHVLREHDVDMREVRFLPNFDPSEAVQLFEGGLGDFIYLAQPWVDRLVDREVGRMFASMSDAVGPLPWSVYMVTPATLEERSGHLNRFVAALNQALDWIHAHDAEEIALTMRDTYRTMHAAELIRVIARAKRLDVWPRDSSIGDGLLDRWGSILSRAGLIGTLEQLSATVDARFNVQRTALGHPDARRLT